MENTRRLFLMQTAGCFIFAFRPIKPLSIMNTQGIITRTSPFEVNETMDKLVVLLETNGATIYSRINQQKEAHNSGKEILPNEFLLFGNPAVGGNIMEANPLAALDLPLKILVWKGADQVVKVSFNDPLYIQKRYSLPIQLVIPLNLTPLVDKALAEN
jgi:uncharacterized protein (DUF302 family)